MFLLLRRVEFPTIFKRQRTELELPSFLRSSPELTWNVTRRIRRDVVTGPPSVATKSGSCTSLEMTYFQIRRPCARAHVSRLARYHLATGYLATVIAKVDADSAEPPERRKSYGRKNARRIDFRRARVSPSLPLDMALPPFPSEIC